MWEFHQKLNFVSTPWKIKIPLGNSVGDHKCVMQILSGWVMIFFLHQSVIY